MSVFARENISAMTERIALEKIFITILWIKLCVLIFSGLDQGNRIRKMYEY
jgi:hypothetical protein